MNLHYLDPFNGEVLTPEAKALCPDLPCCAQRFRITTRKPDQPERDFAVWKVWRTRDNPTYFVPPDTKDLPMEDICAIL